MGPKRRVTRENTNEKRPRRLEWEASWQARGALEYSGCAGVSIRLGRLDRLRPDTDPLMRRCVETGHERKPGGLPTSAGEVGQVAEPATALGETDGLPGGAT